MVNRLLDIIPSAFRSLDVDYVSTAQKLNFPKAEKVILILCDGLGYYNLEKSLSYAPNLRKYFANCQAAQTVVPTTTSVALTSFAFSLPPSLTGILGYKQINPNTNKIINFLNEENLDYAPQFASVSKLSNNENPHNKNNLNYKTNFELANELGAKSATVAENNFRNSFLTNLYCHGSQIYSAKRTRLRINLSLELINEYDLVYLYYSKIDRIGHKYGVFTENWHKALAEFDLYIQRIYQNCPKKTLLLITADHGMINKNDHVQYDIAKHPQLISDIENIASEPRFGYLYLKKSSNIKKVKKDWQDFFGEQIKILEVNELIKQKIFSGIAPQYLSSIGDLTFICQNQTSIIDSRIIRPNAKNMIGLHGATTPWETTIPILPIFKN
ncbi:MAG: alkaline phosphatase family protein [Bifidobacteriaceae bacterium]|jgi:predicted AlkP superfamily pyrophosphatase or phosphodiesterase|nr:alkaline phosphatase family protein [Bifidobacteriaceae bacterium]